MSGTVEGCGCRPNLEQTIDRLNEFFGGKMLNEINTKLCRDYVKSRRRAS